jgi:hypothetical protein
MIWRGLLLGVVALVLIVAAMFHFGFFMKGDPS